MVKLTVFFKNTTIHSKLFESGVIHIGRDESNDLIIDSLAVAPAHAAIIIRDSGCSIKQLNDSFPLIINGEVIKEAILNNNDTLSLGKHDIVFYNSEPLEDTPQTVHSASDEESSFNQEINANLNPPAANLQFIAGKNIGKILPLKKALTRLELSNGGVVIITRRVDGYYVSAIDDGATTTLNDIPVHDSSLKLSDSDVLNFEHSSLQFFMS